MLGASACLVGLNTRFDGGNKLDSTVHRLFVEGEIIPFCPEQLGGLSTPRLRAEIEQGSGEDVLDGKSAVLLEDGTDVTVQFLRGASEVLKAVKELGIKRIYMKTKSPSCGVGRIYLSGKLQKGNGVCAALLLREGIELIAV
ncbi:MAG: DUF523 domain-containing protein [Candidatus Lindowbacteria bacterium]|nr:DUF523 domain-containing protein [Candidatus Lindowbacteria bacterium]